MVGSSRNCRLLGGVQASGLHVHFVDVEIYPKKVKPLNYALPDCTTQIDRIIGQSARHYKQYISTVECTNGSNKNLRCGTGLLLGSGGVACAHL